MYEINKTEKKPNPFHSNELKLKWILKWNSKIQRYNNFGSHSPQEVIQCAFAWCGLLVDNVIPANPTHRVLSHTQESFLITQHATIFWVTDVIRVRQPLDIITFFAWETERLVCAKPNYIKFNMPLILCGSNRTGHSQLRVSRSLKSMV